MDIFYSSVENLFLYSTTMKKILWHINLLKIREIGNEKNHHLPEMVSGLFQLWIITTLIYGENVLILQKKDSDYFWKFFA